MANTLLDMLRLVAVGYLLGLWHGRDWAGGLAIVVILVAAITDLTRRDDTEPQPDH